MKILRIIISINNGKKSNEKVLILKEEEASSEDVANFIQKKNDSFF